MGPKAWIIILKFIEAAFEGAVDYVKEKLKGGKNDSTGNSKA